MYQEKELILHFFIILCSLILFICGILYKFTQGDFDKKTDRYSGWCGTYSGWCGTSSLDRPPSDTENKELNQLFYSLGGKNIRDDAFASGKALFEGNCKQCHSVSQIIVGPQLGNILERRKVKWLLEFIKNPEKMIKKKDKQAVKLYKQYQQIMPNHDFLNDDQIIAILVYLEHEN